MREVFPIFTSALGVCNAGRRKNSEPRFELCDARIDVPSFEILNGKHVAKSAFNSTFKFYCPGLAYADQATMRLEWPELSMHTGNLWQTLTVHKIECSLVYT
jgi:hypothetical protein